MRRGPARIGPRTTLRDLAATVCAALRRAGVEAVLTGGAVVSIYTENAYESSDLDFVTVSDRSRVDEVMKGLGFRREGRQMEYRHPATDLFVEFPAPPLMIGREPIRAWATRRLRSGILHLLAPTECVMDRLAWFYHSNDRQCLDQALLVAARHPVNLARIEAWSRREGAEERYREFLERWKARTNRRPSRRRRS